MILNTPSQQLDKFYNDNAKTAPLLANLDPAASFIPYVPEIDIRKKLNYKDVMKQYGLGPNGAIMTSLNLFSTSADEFADQIEKKSKDKK
mgnify:CR=1 FL=1